MRILILFIAGYLCAMPKGNSTNPLIFDIGPDVSICAGDSLVLSVPLGGDTLSYLWSTGATTPTITVFDAGNYSVEVTTPFCNGTDDMNLTLLPAPVIDFEAEDACFGTPVTITNNSTAEPGANYLLQLGNGNVVNAQFATIDYLYGLPNGTQYNLTLTISNPNGCMASDTTSVQVKKQPFAFISAQSGCAGGSTLITNQTIDTLDASYVLDYGDGGFSFEDYFSVIDYTYNNPGTYQISMFVQNGNGCASDHFTFTSVAASPVISQFNSTTNCFGDSTLFTTSASFAPGATFNWDFGDGSFSSSNSLQLKHLYEDNGANFDATLIIKNPSSVCADTATVPVEVLMEPLGDFEVSGGCFGEPVEIQNSSTGLAPTAA
ncbi:MAG: PKD domain-containing protein, partial [Phaeodactylibacter sp.]|nr:PKD domain-containing protein [Phaeodactylibacter sp.]